MDKPTAEQPSPAKPLPEPLPEPLPAKPGRTRVAVIFGGGSAEQAIGSVGAGDVLDGLDPETYEIVPLGITHDGRWVLESGEGDRRPAVADARVGLRGLGVADVVFPVVRGGFGDDGTVQGLLEMAGLPYVGSGVFAAAATADREFCRKFAMAEGIPVVPHAVLRPGQELTDEERATLGLPVLVRACDVAVPAEVPVSSWDALPAALAIVRGAQAKVVVESVLAARAIGVGVLEGEEFGDARASVAAEGDTVPADLPRDVARRAGELAVRAFAALECSGAVRVTFRLTAAGELLLDGVDPMPEFASTGVLARMWAATGVSYQDLVSSLITTALRKGTSLH